MVIGYRRTTVLDLYAIEEDGDIYSFHESHYGHKITPRLDKDGYPAVSLSFEGKRQSFQLHRLLAQLYIPNPENKPQVNHINGDKSDYSLKNLEWVTASENMQHAVNNGLCKPPVAPRRVIDACTGKQYPSLKEAAADLNISYSNCKKYLTGRTKNKTCLQYVQTCSPPPIFLPASYSEL